MARTLPTVFERAGAVFALEVVGLVIGLRHALGLEPDRAPPPPPAALGHWLALVSDTHQSANSTVSSRNCEMLFKLR